MIQGRNLYFCKSNQKGAVFLLSSSTSSTVSPAANLKGQLDFLSCSFDPFSLTLRPYAAITMCLRYICFHIWCDKHARLSFSLPPSLSFMNSLTDPSPDNDRSLKSGTTQKSAEMLIAEIQCVGESGQDRHFYNMDASRLTQMVTRSVSFSS